MSDMADAISDAAHKHQMNLFDIDVKNLAAALSAAGFGPVREAADEAWELGVIHGHNTEGRLIDKREANPYRTEASS